MKKIFLLLALIIAVPAFAAEVARIEPKEAARLVAEGKAVLVDVREPAEWTETGVVAPANLVPKSDFDGPQKLWKPFLEKTAGKQLILYCRSGRRSGQVAAALQEKGWPVANAGGLKDWQAAGLPVRRADEPRK